MITYKKTEFAWKAWACWR